MLCECQSWWAHEGCPVLFDPTGLATCPELGIVPAHLWCLCLRRDGGDFTPFRAVVAVHFHHSTAGLRCAGPPKHCLHFSEVINQQTYCHITVSKSDKLDGPVQEHWLSTLNWRCAMKNTNQILAIGNREAVFCRTHYCRRFLASSGKRNVGCCQRHDTG